MSRELLSRSPRTLRPAAARAAIARGAPLVLALLGFAASAHAQTRTLTACTPGTFDVCTELRLTAGPSVFEIALRSLGATSAPALPVSVYNLVLSTGAAAGATPRSTDVAPGVTGGAVVRDASPWNVFDTGDLLFLSALTNLGVGGCAVGAPVGGFGQAVTTCGAGQFATFRFTPTAAFDPNRFEILDLEAVGLTASLPAASCGAQGTPCVIVADTRPTAVVPEPSVVVLTAGGLAALAGLARRRRPLA